MTAEIAILNKAAVAIAADSAGSIGVPPNVKIYNSFNKIFELSEHCPVGIMIYGGSEFMGLPIETVVKLYRKRLGEQSFPSILEYKEDFCKFLGTEVPVTDSDDIRNFEVIISSQIRLIYEVAHKEIIRKIQSDDPDASDDDLVDKVTQAIIKSETDKIKDLPFAIGFSDTKLSTRYSHAVKETAERIFVNFEINAKSLELLRKYVGHFAFRQTVSMSSTGFVVTGFGTDELCPSLAYFETDGKIGGKLKFLDKPYVDIGRATTQAQVLGFAQSDMIKSFVNGLDPRIETYFFEQYKTVISKTETIILDKVREKLKLSGSLVDGSAFDALINEMKTAARNFTREASEAPILEMIRHMPKQEMAALASSLIEITSLKRKVTRVQETVGGEVDVAIISKAEGFVWIKRKHYFPGELNPRYFQRTYGKK